MNVRRMVVPSLPETEGGRAWLSIVIPTYNEVENIESLVESIIRVSSGTLHWKTELIVVDDDSPDETWKAAEELARRHPQVSVVRRVGETGLATAVIAGWQRACGQILGVIDGDGQHPPETIPELAEAVLAGADIAIASRHAEGGGVKDWSLSRQLLSHGARVVGRLILPGVFGKVLDPLSGFFLVRREAIQEIPLSPIGYKILVEVLARGRIENVVEVPFQFNVRASGSSKVTWREYRDYLKQLARLRLRRPRQRG